MPLYNQVVKQDLLRYNASLISVFDLLAAARAQITGTNEYIQQQQGDDERLRCVTILVGAFDMGTGEPVAGVVNQPFHTQDDSGHWSGRVVWGTGRS